MKNIWILGLAMGLVASPAIPADNEIEVDQLIKCEDGNGAVGAATDLNSAVVRGKIYGVASRPSPVPGQPDEHLTLVVKQPFKLSAPALYYDDEGNFERMCVTASK